ncbi:MAG: tetratricopeptide repeat protein [Opitutaceae bacterium]|nr:tetratricopeptide repeat protein [Opitutaceae bacterium]
MIEPKRPRAFLRPPSLAAALVAAVAVAYLRSAYGEFIWDDDLHVTANPTIIGPLGLKEIWTTARANYFPLVLTNFWVQHAWFGLNPLPYHVVNIAFHALAAVLLWRVLAQLKIPGAWIGAALWALHPVQVESVAWISELKNTQSAVFFLAAVWCWLKWIDRSHERERVDAPPLAHARSYRSYALALFFALLAILSKPSTVMLPVALVLCSWWMKCRESSTHGLRSLVPSPWSLVLSLVPFFAFSAIAAGWTIWEQKVHSGASGAEWAQTWPERFIIAGRVIWFYLGKLVWPEPLIFIYPRWSITAGNPIAYIPIGAAVAAMAALWWNRTGALRPVLFAAAFFVALLFPVLGFFDVYFFRYSFVGDHFQYLASIGPLALAGAAVARLPRRASVAVAGLAAVALGLLMWRHGGTFRNKETLWRHTVALHPGCRMAWLNLGDTYSRLQRHGEAIAAFQRGLEIDPNDASAHNDLGCELVLQERLEEGVRHLARAVELKPIAEYHANLGNALRKVGRVPEAIRHYERAFELDPNHPSAHNNLGAELAEAGKFEDALRHFETALRARPNDPPTHENIANALRHLGRIAEARTHLEAALRLDPASPLAHKLLAEILFASGRNDEAFAELEKGVTLAPSRPDAHNHVGAALAQAGRLPEAVASFQRAVQLQPRFTAARLNLGMALCGLARWEEAIPQLKAALAVRSDLPDVQAQLAVALVNSGRLDEAIAPFQAALRMTPASTELHNNFAQLLRALGRNREAFEHFEEAARLQRETPRAAPR